MTGVLMRREDTERHRRRRPCDDEAETGAMHPQAREQQGSLMIPEAKGMGQIPPENLQGEEGPAYTFQ